MDRYELQPTTEPGKRFVALAEEHAADFATRADEHDREGSFPHENVDAMRDSGFLAAPVPAELGGMGVESHRDMAIAMSRLARGCASTAIASNMHIVFVQVAARLYRHRDRNPSGAAAEMLLRAVAAKQMIGCGPNTEAGTDLTSPFAELTPQPDGSYKLNGHKIFGTFSEAANMIFPTARLAAEDGSYTTHLVILPKATPGVQVMNNWDALGMRATGSHDITLTDVTVQAGSVQGGRPWGVVDSESADMGLSFNLSLVCCFLGIAEAARDIAVEGVMRKKGAHGKRLADRAPIQQLIAEIEVDLASARAIMDRTATLIDAYLEQYGPGEAPDEVALELYKQQQATKSVLQRNAIQIVDRAMTLSGGAGYMSKHPLSRLYRDVRAGPFMQPFAPYEAMEYIGKVTLGLPPQIDR